jgi:hypothetical protein
MKKARIILHLIMLALVAMTFAGLLCFDGARSEFQILNIYFELRSQEAKFPRPQPPRKIEIHTFLFGPSNDFIG